MRFWRQLRWHLVAAPMIVVIVGVVTLFITAEWVLPQVLTAQLPPYFLENPDFPPATLQSIFRQATLNALLLAATAATVVGLITALLLSRQILRPLQALASASRRIATGQYRERLAIPVSDEVAEVARNFNQMAESLEHIEQQRITLIANVAHELRTPLTGISGYLEGLMDGLLPQTPETFAQMSQEVRRLNRLVNDLQELSRVESGQVSLNLIPVAVEPVVQTILSQLQPQITAKELTLTLRPATPPVTIQADPDRTTQILINLIGNAIRYTPEGGAITITITQSDHICAIAIQDTGEGIPTAALPYLFERFYRVDPSRARQSGGSGIGLTISRHLAWAMGGDITVASEGEGKGSTFTLTLPLV